MSVTLPSDVAWVLNLLGFMWPEADEDKLRASAQAWRDFGAELDRINQDARQVAVQIASENRGDSIDAFGRFWHGVGGGGGDFDRAKEAAGHMATALDAMAMLVEGVKVAVIAQLGILAAEIIADQIAAPETLGLSEGVAAGEIIVTRGIVRRLIQEGIHRVGREIVQSLKGRALELFRRIVATALRRAVTAAVVSGGADAAKQEIQINVFHDRKNFDLGELAGATGTGAVLGAVIPARGRRHGLREGGNDYPSRTGSAVHPRVPPYDGVKTKGVFAANGQEVSLRSQGPGPGEWITKNLPGGPGTGKNGIIASHVEGHAAGLMHINRVKDADLYINNIPCDKGGQCRFNLAKIMPEGSTLRVHFPDPSDGSIKVWEFRHGVPPWRVL
jgi:hypothetical protein